MLWLLKKVRMTYNLELEGVVRYGSSPYLKFSAILTTKSLYQRRWSFDEIKKSYQPAARGRQSSQPLRGPAPELLLYIRAFGLLLHTGCVLSATFALGLHCCGQLTSIQDSTSTPRTRATRLDGNEGAHCTVPLRLWAEMLGPVYVISGEKRLCPCWRHHLY
jgi:hypothetical protein